MTGFAVYSSEYTPRRLYSDGERDPVDTDLVEEVVRFGDRPLDLYVDLDQRRLLWSFKAERHTKSARTGYFVAAYRGSGEDLFRDFEEKLRRLHDSAEWAIPHTGELRWDTGFELWRIPATVPGLSSDRFQELARRLREGGRNRPIEFGMRTHRSALQVVRALDEAAVSCTVAVGSSGDVTALSDPDLLLRPGGERDFEPLSALAADITENETTGEHTDRTVSERLHRGRERSGSFLSRIASAVLLVFLGFAAYSFVEPSPVKPLTGLSTLGGLLGSLAAMSAGAWLLDGEHPERGGGRVREALRADTDRSMILLSYGTLLGFGFPRIMWEVGVAAGNDGSPFGPITTLSSSLPTVGVYVLGVFLVSSVVAIVQRRRDDHDDPLESLLPALAVGHAVYALALLLATGFASSLWFTLIPSA